MTALDHSNEAPPMRAGRPVPLGDPVEHLEMIHLMARATGADLAAAQAVGRLDEATWAGAVEGCRRCGWTKGCRRWLGARRSGRRRAPAGCVNGWLMEALAEG